MTNINRVASLYNVPGVNRKTLLAQDHFSAEGHNDQNQTRKSPAAKNLKNEESEFAKVLKNVESVTAAHGSRNSVEI